MMEANKQHLQDITETLAGITESCEAGIQRRSYSSKFREAVLYIKKEMEKIGLTVREDTVGNLFGMLPGSEVDLPEIMSGSHLDTVRCAGAFDGAAGVVCALEAARMIKESDQPMRHPYTVFGTVGEEGTRFGQVLLGSRFMTGSITNSDLDTVKDLESGESLRSVLSAYGLNGDIQSASLFNRKIKAFVELHGEQGPVLDQSGKEIGIVQSIAGIAWIKVTVIGQAGHSGTVPMGYRKDAGIAAYEMIIDMNTYVMEKYIHSATMTVGQLTLNPGSSNCIPGKAVFTVDFRSGNKEILQDLVETIYQEASVKEKDGYQISVCVLNRRDPVNMNQNIQSAIRESCEELGYSYQYLNSGAGHDSMIFAPFWPTAMIFLPNKDGISHNPKEYISWDEMKKGTEVLYHTLRHLDRLDDEPQN